MDIDKKILEYEGIFRDISQYNEMYEKESLKTPYRINIISELHDNENAHSRILLQLLRYSDNGNFRILASFVRMLQGICETDINIDVSTPTITDQFEYIDGLIAEKNKYALIIENKIWGAVDQYEQIQRYIESVKCYSKDNIYVVYLTMDGTKIVSDYSLTANAKRQLQSGKRFIPISYKYDIIPWLKNEVYPNCKLREEYLQSAVHQYVDYLEDVNGMHDYQQKIKKIILNQIYPKLNSTNQMDKFKEIDSKLKEIEKLRGLLLEEKEKMVKSVMDLFTKLTKEILGDEFKINNRVGKSTYYQIWKQTWDSHIHLEWVPLIPDMVFGTVEAYTFVLHVEGGWAKKEFGAKLRSNATLKSINEQNNWSMKSATFYSRDFECEKALGEMSGEEMRSYLTSVYKSDDVCAIIKMVDDAFSELE